MPSRTGSRRGRVEGVQQFEEGHRWWSVRAGVLVGAGVGDHQGLGGGEDRVEQQLAVLGPDVALTGRRLAGQRVVAVHQIAAREDPVVKSDQAYHPVRHRAHRHHRADRQRAGAEVRPGGPTGETRSAAARARRSAASGVAAAGFRGSTLANSRCTWPDCQTSAAADRGQRRHRRREWRAIRSADGSRSGGRRRGEPFDVLGEPARERRCGRCRHRRAAARCRSRRGSRRTSRHL